MAQHTFELEKGLMVGNVPQTTVVLRELTAGDVVAALEESEKLIMVPGPNGMQPALVQSNAMMGINTLRRQIASLGEIQGPLERDKFDLLSGADLEILQAEADKMDAAVLGVAVADRGRSEAADSDD